MPIPLLVAGLVALAGGITLKKGLMQRESTRKLRILMIEHNAVYRGHSILWTRHG